MLNTRILGNYSISLFCKMTNSEMSFQCFCFLCLAVLVFVMPHRNNKWSSDVYCCKSFPSVYRILRKHIDIHFPPAVFKLINFKILLSALFDAHSLTLPSLTSQLPHWVKFSLKKLDHPFYQNLHDNTHTCRQAHYRCRIYLQLGVKAAHFAQKSFIYSVLPNIFRQTTEACTRWKEKGASPPT